MEKKSFKIVLVTSLVILFPYLTILPLNKQKQNNNVFLYQNEITFSLYWD